MYAADRRILRVGMTLPLYTCWTHCHPTRLSIATTPRVADSAGNDHWGKPGSWFGKGGREVHRQDFCVYNQTNECFLSLGATLGDRPLARLKQWLGIGSHRVDEGCWIFPQKGRRALGFFSARDLVYLDANHRVVHVIESLPVLRTAPFRSEAASLLALPVHTISSSHTQPGNQLLICAASEMELRLRALIKQEVEQNPPGPAMEAGTAPVATHSPGARRIESPVAYYADGGKLSIHAIRDLCATGLFLVTRDRWPIGAEVKMSLQPIGGLDDRNSGPVTVRMRVKQWGVDGVALEFAGNSPDSSGRQSLYVC